jgi:hypothetical protein
VQDQWHVLTPPQQLDVEVVVELALAGGDDRAVGPHVLGVRQDEVVAEQRERLAQRVRVRVQVRGIDDDLQPLGAQLVEQPPSRPHGVDDVVALGLEAERHAVLLGGRERGLEAGEHVPPGLGRAVVRVPAPHVGRVSRAGAERHDPGAERRCRRDQRAEAAPSVGAHSRVGVRHVVGARHGRRREPATLRRLADRNGGDVLGQRRPADEREVELDRPQAAVDDGVEHRAQIGTRERLGEDPDLRHASATFSPPPASERSIAASTRIAARPS